MNSSKKQRYRYRSALRDQGLLRTDRFTDMMLAVTGGGSHACSVCRLIRPAASLDTKRVCYGCRERLYKMREQVGKQDPPVRHTSHGRTEPNVVWSDASFRDGIAGLAVVGALGEHFQRIEAVSSTQAEVLALQWAVEMARIAGLSGLTFRTDCQAAWRALLQHRDNRIELIPRERNRRADLLAAHARRHAH